MPDVLEGLRSHVRDKTYYPTDDIVRTIQLLGAADPRTPVQSSSARQSKTVALRGSTTEGAGVLISSR